MLCFLFYNTRESLLIQIFSFSFSGASYTAMLRYLGADNVLLLFYLVLTEHKVLFHSLRPALLTSVAEALTTVRNALITSPVSFHSLLFMEVL